MLEKKIYGSIFLSTMASFTITELCKLSNSKKPAVSKVVEKLLKAKKICKEGNRYKIV
jgi:DNA-binding transcriptional regulator GbsR (MarR family)